MINKILRRLGFSLVKLEPNEKTYPNVEPAFWKYYRLCKPFTMTTPERLYALYNSVKYVLNNNIPGDFVECGVWKGGNPVMMATMLMEAGVTDRKIYLYDTYEGMSEPTANDTNFKGNDARQLLDNSDKADQASVWCFSQLDEVKQNLRKTGYPEQNLVFVKGKVEDTMPSTLPGAIALLRLDTDWYESTLHELWHLFPLLSSRGVLIIDDYGYWEGCRKATDQYFREQGIPILLQRIDSTGRIAIKF
jgi:hypothetical protein